MTVALALVVSVVVPACTTAEHTQDVTEALYEDYGGDGGGGGGYVSDMTYEGTWYGYMYKTDDSAETGVGGTVRYDSRNADLVSENSRTTYQFDGYLPFGEAVINIVDQPEIGRAATTTYSTITIDGTPEGFLQRKFDEFVSRENVRFCLRKGC
jgi:hypothetical protein